MPLFLPPTKQQGAAQRRRYDFPGHNLIYFNSRPIDRLEVTVTKPIADSCILKPGLALSWCGYETEEHLPFVCVAKTILPTKNVSNFESPVATAKNQEQFQNGETFWQKMVHAKPSRHGSPWRPKPGPPTKGCPCRRPHPGRTHRRLRQAGHHCDPDQRCQLGTGTIASNRTRHKPCSRRRREVGVGGYLGSRYRP